MRKLIYSSLLLIPLISAAQVQGTGSSDSSLPNATGSASAQNAQPPKIAESSLSQVHDRLNLTDSQQPLWSDYVARINEYSKVYYQEKPASAFSGDAAPRQIGKFIDNMQNRLAALDDVERSSKALYAALDAGQKQIADQLLFSTIPVFASSANAACPSPNEGKPRNDRPEGGQHKRRGGGGGMGQ